MTVTPLPGNLMPSSGFCEHMQAHGLRAGKILKYIKVQERVGIESKWNVNVCA